MTSPWNWNTGQPSVVLADKTMKAHHKRSTQSMLALEKARREGRSPLDVQPSYGRHYPQKLRGTAKGGT